MDPDLFAKSSNRAHHKHVIVFGTKTDEISLIFGWLIDNGMLLIA
jgi:hypothetical protein